MKLAQNPLNLALRFGLEIAALIAMGYWGWRQVEGFGQYALAFGLPILAAVLWGVFRVPGDPGDAPVAVPGIVRLALEAAFFGFSTWGLYNAGATTAALIFGGLTFFHYLISIDRISSLLKR